MGEQRKKRFLITLVITILICMKVTETDPGVFWEALERARKLHGLSERRLSRTVGMSEPYLTNMRRRAGMPSMSVRIALSRALGSDLTLRHTAPIKVTGQKRSEFYRSEQPDVLDVIRWLRQNDNTVDFDNEVMEFSELFTLPQHRGAPVPTHMGRQSLTALSLSISTVEELAGIFKSAPEHLRKTVLRRHRQAMKGAPQVAFREIFHQPIKGDPTKIEYLQLLHLVREPGGASRILNYALPL